MACEPIYVRAGDSWEWTATFEGYSSLEGWSLTYVLNAPAARFAFPAGAVAADGEGGFAVALTPAQTKACAAGEYQVIAVLTNVDDSRRTLELKTVEVQPNIADATGAIDEREFDEIVLDGIKATIAGSATDAVLELTIHGRMIRNMDPRQLEEYRGIYEWRVRQLRRLKGQKVPAHATKAKFTGVR